MRVLLDTNIILDFILIRQPFYAEADRIFVALQNSEFEGFVSSITPINIFYILRKEKGKDIAFKAIEELLKLVRVAECSETILKNALSLGFNDFEDAVQHECAIAEHLDAIVTRNIKNFLNASVTVYALIDFLSQFKTS